MISQNENSILMILVLVTGIFLVTFGGLIIKTTRRRKSQLNSKLPEPATELPELSSLEKMPVAKKAELKLVVPIEQPKEKTLREAMFETEKNIFGRIKNLFKESASADTLSGVEEVLYTSDIGGQTVQRLISGLEKELSRSEKKDLQIVQSVLKGEFAEIFSQAANLEPEASNPLAYVNTKSKPTVWLVVGVNGVGKTTTIGKLAYLLAERGLKVLVAAGDTFRAAAESQLKVWTERAQVEIFSPEGVKDPSAVAFDAVAKAKAQGYDVVIVDTAGRLHTQTNLMEELKKMRRVIQKHELQAPHETLIVLDANSGQNALVQAREFHQALGLTGVVLTKMDGTAKGGVAIGLANELKIPIRFIGVGESVKDLRPFSSKDFIESIFT